MIEQTLIDLTTAITRLTTVMVTAAESGSPTSATTPSVQAAEAVGKASRTSKKAATADTVTDAVAKAPTQSVEPTTRYFHIPAHNTVYMQRPGDPDCTLQGALIVSRDEYLLQKEAIEKKFPTAAAPLAIVTTAPSVTAPAATASVIATTFEQVIDKMRQLQREQSQEGIKKVLSKFGVSRVPELQGKVSNDELIAEIDSALVGL